jgi:hypothetical protein
MLQCHSQFFSPENKLLFTKGVTKTSLSNQVSRRIAPLPELKDVLISRNRANSTSGSQKLIKFEHKKRFTSLDHEVNTSVGALSQCADLKSSRRSIIIDEPNSKLQVIEVDIAPQR